MNKLFEENIIFKGEISGASKINRILTQHHPAEIPIFGSSRAQGSYVPTILGKSYFNYGIDGAQSNVWLFFLEEELKKEKTSTIIINFDLTGLQSSTGDVANYLPNYRDTWRLIPSERRYYYNIPFVKYFGTYESYLKYYLNERLNLTKVTDNGGSFEKNQLTTQKFQELVQIRKGTSEKFQLNDLLRHNLYELLNSTNRNVFFVIAPYHSSYFEKFENLEEATKFLAVLDLRENVKVFDFSKRVYADSLFMNTTHLNYKGAQIFSEELKTLLEIP